MRILLLLLVIIGQQVAAQESATDRMLIELGLREFPIEDIDDQQHFDSPYFVRIESGHLVIDTKGQVANQTKYKLDGVEYVGENNGEWGGKLEVIVDGETTELMQGNIVHLLPKDEKLYVIEGLAHLTMSSGSISVIPDAASPTKPELVTLLPDAPRLVYVDPTRPEYQPILIVGYRSIMALSPFQKLEILHWDGFWSYRYSPTSIVRFKDSYILGLQHGVAVIPAPWGSQDIKYYVDGVYNSAH